MQELIKLIEKLLTDWGISWLVPHVDWLIPVLSGGLGLWLLAGFGKLFKAGIHLCRNRRLKKDLHPYFSPVEIKKATRYYVPTRCQNIDPSREQEPGFTHAVATKEKLVNFFIKRGFKFVSSAQRFYIILADSGMGKTTFMINLYLKYVTRRFGERYHIKLLPLGYPNIDREIEKIPDEQQENTILLLDAFDEDSQAVADYKKRMDELLEKVHRFRKVIFTCRTQFFPSEEEEPGETGILKYGSDKGFHTFYKLYISPFDEKDIKKYLRKKFSFFQFKKKARALRIVENSPNLMVRPMLLSYIHDLLQSGRRYQYSYEIYEELINKWIEREARRYKEEKREKFKEELYRFSRVIALDIYHHRESRQGLIIPEKEIESFAAEHQIDLEHMEMKSRSLLNRNASGDYKFAHKSILEYFLAREANENYKFYQEFSFEGMDQAKSFYDDIWKLSAFEFLTGHHSKGEYLVSELGISWKDLSKLKLEELESIDALILKDNQLTDISILKDLKKLDWLNLSNNRLSDITALRDLKKLTHLELNSNQIADISILKDLKNLEELGLTGNPIPGNQIRELRQSLPGAEIDT